jgi:uncharacterized protein
MKTKILVMLTLLVVAVSASATAIDITTFGSLPTQNFDSLANSGTANTSLPGGWELTETGGGARDNEAYGGDNGSSTTGDTYSYGAASNTERALGGLRSGTLIPVFGVQYKNVTGGTITSLAISYTGEEWRLGAAARTDQLDFQYSLDGTSLTTGIWTDADALDFITPNTVTAGAHDGNAAANRTAISFTITGLSIGTGSTFWFRWNDLDIAGSEDGLAIDDFSLTAEGVPPSVPDTGTTAILLSLPLLGLIAFRRFAIRTA